MIRCNDRNFQLPLALGQVFSNLPRKEQERRIAYLKELGVLEPKVIKETLCAPMQRRRGMIESLPVNCCIS